MSVYHHSDFWKRRLVSCWESLQQKLEIATDKQNFSDSVRNKSCGYETLSTCEDQRTADYPARVWEVTVRRFAGASSSLFGDRHHALTLHLCPQVSATAHLAKRKVKTQLWRRAAIPTRCCRAGNVRPKCNQPTGSLYLTAWRFLMIDSFRCWYFHFLTEKQHPSTCGLSILYRCQWSG